MKHVKLFESFANEISKTELTSVNENKYASAGKLGYNDQFLNKKQSLAKTLSNELGLTREFVGPFLGFDYVSLYAIGPNNIGGTIVDDALTGKYTYDDLKAAAVEYLKDKKVDIKESVVNERLSKSEVSKVSDYLMGLDAEELMELCDELLVDDEEYQDIRHDLDKDDFVEYAIEYIEAEGIKLKDVKSIL